MKRIILVFIASVFATASFAQVSGGIKAGINFANQTYSDNGISISADALTGFHGGFYVTAMLSEKAGIQPELLYSLQGAQSTIGTTTQKSKCAYLNIPVLFRYNIVPQFNLHAGPQLGLLLSAEDENGTSFKDLVKSTDVGFAFGAGFDLPAGLNGGLRYTLGLSDINGDSSTSITIKNTNLQIYVGWRLFGDSE